MTINSCVKGKVGERELAAFLREAGFSARRGQQHVGGGDSPDVVSDIEGVHFEVKRVEKGVLYDWLAQAQRDCGGKVPVVAHRKNRADWVAILPLSDLLNLFKERDA